MPEGNLLLNGIGQGFILNLAKKSQITTNHKKSLNNNQKFSNKIGF